MEYTLPKQLQSSIKNEIGNVSYHNRKVIFGEIAKNVFPNMKRCALMIGDKVELMNYESR